MADLSPSLLATESTIRVSAWDLLSAAARMALDAGWHRMAMKRGDVDQRRKRIIFWLIYSMDRTLSLSLGRAPMIPDYDIQTDRLSYPEDVRKPMSYLLVLWVDVGELQGHIYFDLYSAQAQRQPVQVKAEAAKRLAARCLKIQETMRIVSSPLTYEWLATDLDKREKSIGDMPARAQEALQGQEIIFQSTLLSPFVPFISVFGNTIAQADSQDLALLEAFVLTLECAAEHSHAIRKLYRACSSFHQIAKVYIAQHSQHVASLRDRAESVAVDSRSMDTIVEDNLQALPEFSMSQQEWDVMLSDWDLGLGTEEARQMSSFLDLLPVA
ncbi:MAG: hypothetical protein LQ341_004599 [Variospora aurantia]|nr:MAG: hypothetical protein LQ341_004599 [Variospora aurantia]